MIKKNSMQSDSQTLEHLNIFWRYFFKASRCHDLYSNTSIANIESCDISLSNPILMHLPKTFQFMMFHHRCPTSTHCHLTTPQAYKGAGVTAAALEYRLLIIPSVRLPTPASTASHPLPLFFVRRRGGFGLLA